MTPPARINPATGRQVLRGLGIAKTGKYGNVRTEYAGLKFDSRAEARRAAELELLERAGKIRGLCRQVRFPLKVNDQLITTYICDFQYFDTVTGRKVIEDVKGVRTREYVIKKKLMRAIYEIEISEVEA